VFFSTFLSGAIEIKKYCSIFASQSVETKGNKQTGCQSKPQKPRFIFTGYSKFGVLKNLFVKPAKL
jgi:hypothetical protein